MEPLYRSGQQEVHQHYWPEERGVAARLVNSRSGRTSGGGILARILKAPEPTVPLAVQPGCHDQPALCGLRASLALTGSDVALLTEQARGGVRQV